MLKNKASVHSDYIYYWFSLEHYHKALKYTFFLTHKQILEPCSCSLVVPAEKPSLSGLLTHQTLRYLAETRGTRAYSVPHCGLCNEAWLLMTHSPQQEIEVASSGAYLIGTLCCVVTAVTFRSLQIRLLRESFSSYYKTDWVAGRILIKVVYEPSAWSCDNRLIVQRHVTGWSSWRISVL